MEALITINNLVGPWLSEICAAFWLITSITLLRTWRKSRTPDALLVFSYLTGLVIVANIPETWLNLSSLAVIHLLMYTLLVWSHAAHGFLRTGYGHYLQLMAALFVLTDSLFLAWSLPIQYQVWILDALFLLMNISTLYVCFKSNHNGGNMGKYHAPDHSHHKGFAQPAKS